MQPKQKLGMGAVLAVFGGAGIALAPLLGATQLNAPWSFLTGFILGMAAGLGIALSIWGIRENRR